MKIHIVSLTIPWPPNYGGAIDIFYKLKYLNKLGLKIHLHCYQYDREQAIELEEICTRVSYYKRELKFADALSIKPFIVKSRENKQLIEELNKDTNCIIVEGIHGLSLLDKVDNNRLFVRTHNVEQDYYKALAKASNSAFKKLYYYLEHIKLKSFELNLKFAKGLFCISPNDLNFFRRINKNAVLIPPFHQNSSVNTLEGKGDYILIHGNLQVEENIKSVEYLLNNILNKVRHQVIIAGRKPSEELINKCNTYSHIKIIDSPGHNEMEQLIKNAQVILLHTFQNTGIKLKLINSLYSGRHVICNNLMAENTMLDKLANSANTDTEWISQIDSLMQKAFMPNEITLRQRVLDKYYNNTESAKKLYSILESGTV
ncbi:glycosyltransferase [Carboxylicivirga marina]|uniref:Mannosyltransferase n=1 Tax=Carboxylicivirga marina TaxID=2800988 RepID=A0ABS1HNK0_9BACT|nr:hypothetical protein [Carboxylicivirga marina]MBK3519211.1 hypothetical protein [Carboxylicivirga marina]